MWDAANTTDAYDPIEDALDALAHMGARRSESNTVSVPCEDGGEILLNQRGDRWDVGRYGADGSAGPMRRDVAGEDVVETVASMP